MPSFIYGLLTSPVFAFLARVALTFPFWLSGIVKAADFNGAIAEMQQFGLEPPNYFAIATIVTQLLGSLLVIINRGTWLGAGALAVFTIATVPIAHNFWAFEGEKRMMEMFFVFEHVAVIGGMMLVSALSAVNRDRY